jgi:DNA-binding CsgD family transcriptional regulator
MDVDQDRLSQREEEILRLASQGLTDKEIASNLGVQISTVRTYWDRLKTKLSAANRTEAVARSLRHSQDGRISWDLLAAMPHSLVVTDPVGNIVFANDRAKSYFGIENSANLSWAELVCEDDLDALGCKESIALVRCRRKDGVYRRHVVTQSVLEIKDGTVRKWVRSAVDIQELSLQK